MYTNEQLLKYPYFAKVLKSGDASGIVDSLTGLISRRYMIEFIQELVENNVPFTLALLDLDNFKFINDTYGHKIGDGVLTGLASDLVRYLGDYGVAGRFGGDEFLIVNFRDLTYDDIKAFYSELYSDYNVLRKNIALGVCEPFITGTIGSATYPKDAQDYEMLFGMVDKTLYRGKTKGRNCYIIYVEEKHKNIEMHDLAGRGLYAILQDLSRGFDSQSLLSDKLKVMLNILDDDLRISDLYYVGADNCFRNVSAGDSLGQVYDLDKLIVNDIYTTNEIRDIQRKSPSLYELCKGIEFETVLIIRVGIQEETFGYLVCAEPRSLRIWQDDEYAIMFFVAKMLAMYLQVSSEKM